ncbi:MAG: hypothetical protein KKB51_15990 [Candidatus Riflebacteria bacterium]|nr:hypothetical protein [Candidatus Riflebacteria bacterium]
MSEKLKVLVVNVFIDMEREYRLVVLLALKLGKVNGEDVLKAIRARHPTKTVIMITSYEMEMADLINKEYQIGA